MPRDDLIRFRAGRDQLWDLRDPVLDLDEPGYARDSRTLKIGDGETPWADLDPVAFGEEGPQGPPGPEGPEGDPGPPGETTFPDLVDLTLVFENGLI